MSSEQDKVKEAGVGVVVLLVAVVILAVICGVFWWFNSSNPETPAGYVGYITRGAWFGKTKFVDLQQGPTSTGRGWLLQVTNVSITPYTYLEKFEGNDGVVAKDNLKVQFVLNVVWQVDAALVKDFVEKYSTLRESDNPESIVKTAYENCLQQSIRTFAREEVEVHDGLTIKDSIREIGERIAARVQELAEGTPFKIRSIVVGNIHYPDAVTESVARKLAKTQELEQKLTEIEIAKREKDKRIVEAEGIAKSMEIIQSKLTAQYLQHEAIEAQKAMVGSPNHTTVYIPTGAMGVPLVGTFDVARQPPTEAQPEGQSQ